MDIPIPANGWLPRAHQEKLWTYLESGGKRAVAIWHRRAGKDEICLHHAATSAMARVGNYWHCLPEFLQARKAIWTAINAHTGKRRIDEAFPENIRASTLDHDMFIRFVNGSTWQCIGSDRYDATVGAGVAGITYSEWALSNPAAWAYHRPILEENNGWATFITTPRGHNHAKDMLAYAQRTPSWFAQILTVHDTHTLSEEQLSIALDEYKSLYGEDVGRAQFEQEYLCSFTAAILGAYYALEMQAVRREARVCEIEHDLDLPVHTAWDLGVTDDTSIWWFQVRGAQVYILDHYAASGVGVEHYADVLKAREEKHGWRTGTCFVPHDAKVKEWGSGRTRVEIMQRLGLKPDLVRHTTFEDGIAAARRTLPLCLFHPRCENGGISALEQYRREWDQDKKAFKPTHVHDWTSHPSDAFRYLALAWRTIPRPAPERKPKQSDWVIPPPDELHDRRSIKL
jgi:phage terminase large subunit